LKQVFEFIRKLGNWLFRIFIWLLLEPKKFWITLLPFLVGFIFLLALPAGIFNGLYFYDTLETRFRLTGLILELLGICAVVYGLNDTLKLFLGKHLLHIIPEWFKRLPKFRNNHRLGVNPVNGALGLRGALLTTKIPAPTSTIENRVSFLEEQIKQVRSQAFKDRIYFENKYKTLVDALNTERSEREDGDKQAQQDLKEFAVGDAFIELMGVIWLFFGAIFATASTELAKLFGCIQQTVC